MCFTIGYPFIDLFTVSISDGDLGIQDFLLACDILLGKCYICLDDLLCIAYSDLVVVFVGYNITLCCACLRCGNSVLTVFGDCCYLAVLYGECYLGLDNFILVSFVVNDLLVAVSLLSQSISAVCKSFDNVYFTVGYPFINCLAI